LNNLLANRSFNDFQIASALLKLSDANASAGNLLASIEIAEVAFTLQGLDRRAECDFENSMMGG
jgi:hypothetical protein